MCDIDQNTQNRLDAAFNDYVSTLDYHQRSSFTALDFVRAKELDIPRPVVSRWLRDKFNHAGLIGWASTITQEGGPILYFRVVPSSPAGRRVAKINAAILATEETGDPVVANPTDAPSLIPISGSPKSGGLLDTLDPNS